MAEIKMDNYEQITGDILGIKPDYQEKMKVFLTSINDFVDVLNKKITDEVGAALNTETKKTALCNLIRKEGNKNFFNLMGNNSEEDGYFEYLKVYLAGEEGEEGKEVADVMKDFYINGDKTAFITWFESYKTEENRKYIEWADKIIEQCPTPIELIVKEIRQDNDDPLTATDSIYNLPNKDKEIKIEFQGKTNSSININYKKLEIKNLTIENDYEQKTDHILIKSDYIKRQEDNKEFTLIFDPDIYKEITLKFKTPPAGEPTPGPAEPTVREPAAVDSPTVDPPAVEPKNLKIATG